MFWYEYAKIPRVANKFLRSRRASVSYRSGGFFRFGIVIHLLYFVIERISQR